MSLHSFREEVALKIQNGDLMMQRNVVFFDLRDVLTFKWVFAYLKDVYFIQDAAHFALYIVNGSYMHHFEVSLKSK